MKRRLIVLWMWMCLGIISTAHADDVLQLLACMQANVPPAVRVQDLQLSSTDRSGGTRTLRGRLAVTSVKGPGGETLVRSALRIKAPDSLAGAAYLIRETADEGDPGMYVYLPSVRRVRRVSGSFADGALLGTDFSYNDFKQLQNAFTGSVAVLDGDEVVEQRKTQVLAFAPKQAQDSKYSRVRVSVDVQTCVPLKARFESGGQTIKELTVPIAGLRRSGSHWYASQMQMRNLKEGTHSELSVSEIKAPPSLTDTLFDPQLFYQGNGL